MLAGSNHDPAKIRRVTGQEHRYNWYRKHMENQSPRCSGGLQGYCLKPTVFVPFTHTNLSLPTRVCQLKFDVRRPLNATTAQSINSRWYYKLGNFHQLVTEEKLTCSSNWLFFVSPRITLK